VTQACVVHLMVRLCVSRHACMRTCVHARMRAWVPPCMYVRPHACMHARMCACGRWGQTLVVMCHLFLMPNALVPQQPT
jgi:hypothetical protein